MAGREIFRGTPFKQKPPQTLKAAAGDDSVAAIVPESGGIGAVRRAAYRGGLINVAGKA